MVALVLVLSSLGGGSGKNTAKTSPSTTSTVRAHTHHSHPSTPASSHPSESTVAASPAETHVVVLNGTTTEGLAHKLSASLQQSGYSQSTPLNGTPPGAHQTTVVEYAPGHRADAQGVANVLSVSEVQPLEAPVSSLAAGATVVVVAGLDKAAAVGETSGAAGASSENNSEAGSASSAAG